jgi:hypothetical protein
MVVALCAPTAASADQSASLLLRGFVPERSSIQLLDVNPIVSTDLRAAVTNALVARVVETSNSVSGYTVKIVSENGMRQERTGLVNRHNGLLVPYFLSYGGKRLEFAGGEAALKRARRPSGDRTLENELRISTEGSEELPTGEYSDTVTIAITAR